MCVKQVCELCVCVCAASLWELSGDLFLSVSASLLQIRKGSEEEEEGGAGACRVVRKSQGAADGGS